MAGAFGFLAFAGDAFPIMASLGNQVERVRRKTEFMLRDRQAAVTSSHGKFSFQAGVTSAAKWLPYFWRGSTLARCSR
jgi:hypothetical protein